MSRFRKLAQTIWHCQYHIVFVPKYRFRILIGEVAQETEACIRAFVEQQKGELVELNIQIDHVHQSHFFNQYRPLGGRLFILSLRLLWKGHFQNGFQKTMKNHTAGFSLKLF